MTRVAREHLAATRQLVTRTAAANKLFAFRQFAAEAGRLVVFGEAEEADIIAALTAIAHDAHLGDADTIRNEVAHAIAHPYVTPAERRRRQQPGARKDRERSGSWAPTPPQADPAEPPPRIIDGVVIRCAADIRQRPIAWLWEERIAIGKVCVFAGMPAVGKSQVSLAIAATLSRGGLWPNGEGRAPLGNSIVLSAEDSAADTVTPRLEAAGADMARIHLIDAVREGRSLEERMFTFVQDIARLEAVLEAMPEVRLAIVDPVTAYLGNLKEGENMRLRALMMPLTALAERKQVAILAITHFNKNSSEASALNRIIGSVGMPALSRTACVALGDPDDPDKKNGRRLFLPAKTNIGRYIGGIGVSIVGTTLASGIKASRAVWDDKPVRYDADEALAALSSAPSQRHDAPVRDAAADFLRGLLKDGPHGAREIEAEAKSAGLAMRTLYRAKETLGVRLEKQGRDGPWMWSLPAEPGDDA